MTVEDLGDGLRQAGLNPGQVDAFVEFEDRRKSGDVTGMDAIRNTPEYTEATARIADVLSESAQKLTS